MDKKRGFTLVELLAVIAILAILVIMALPAVLRMYRQSRINNFQNEIRSTYRAAQNQFLADSILLGTGDHIVYTDTTTTCAAAGSWTVKHLDMTGSSKFHYLIEMTVSGQVVKVRATNETYSFSRDRGVSSTDDDGIKVEEIVVDSLSKAASGNNDAVAGNNDLYAYDKTITVCDATITP